ncbi:MAG: hypothetical protein ABWY30_09620, partial [Microterricola sp.]
MLLDALPLARHELDRDAVARGDAGLIARLRDDPATRVLALSAGSAMSAQQFEGSAPALAWLLPDELPDAVTWLYLGRGLAGDAEQRPLLAALLSREQAEAL